jgi:hypothetical protein
MDYSRQDFSTWSGELLGAGSKNTQIPIGSKIVQVHIIQSGSGTESWLSCGGYKIATNYTTTNSREANFYLSFTSTTTCNISKTGTDKSFFVINYSTPQQPSTTTASETLTPDGIALVFGMAIAIVFASLFWWKNRFDIRRYE